MVGAPLAAAASLPPDFVETEVASGLVRPTAMAFAPDGRLFVTQQGGVVRVIKDGALLAAPFVSLVVDSSGERGLLGVAFDPGFAVNGFVYLYYTATTEPRHNRVSRFTASGDVAVSGSENAILDLENLSTATNHNGGALHFGPDGKLYVAVGENATGSNAQTLANRLGKLLRVNADGSIPADNPFYATAAGANRAIWALGLRNPFTFAFQPGSGRMFINDVGQVTWEEINDGFAGANYGWPDSEGPTLNPLEVSPVYAYLHGSGSFRGCAITGGAFYNPAVPAFPASDAGAYFFADYCGGWINRLGPGGNAVASFATGIAAPVDLQVGPDGQLYYLARGGTAGAGVVYRIGYMAGPGDPPALHGAVSRKQHGAAGAFDLPLSLVAADPTTEPRQGPGATVVLTFDKAISGADVAVTEGTATAGAPSFSGSDVVVTLAGVADAQFVTLTLAGVTAADGGAGGSGVVRIGFLAGDTGQNRVVTRSDLLAVNAALAQAVTGANYLRDVNASGSLSLADLLLVNANLTHALPPPAP